MPSRKDRPHGSVSSRLCVEMQSAASRAPSESFQGAVGNTRACLSGVCLMDALKIVASKKTDMSLLYFAGSQ